MPYLPDLNVWLALSWAGHQHSAIAWEWFDRVAEERLLFCRLTQIGLLRLLSTRAVMGDSTLTLRGAWGAYDAWIGDGRIALIQEPGDIDDLFRLSTKPLLSRAAPKALADSYLIGLGQAVGAQVVTFDGGLAAQAKQLRAAAVLL